MLYTIEDKTLTAMGDAVRSYTGKYTTVDTSTEGHFFEFEYDTRNYESDGMDYNKTGYNWRYYIDLSTILGDKRDLTKYCYVEWDYEVVGSKITSGLTTKVLSYLQFNPGLPWDEDTSVGGGYSLQLINASTATTGNNTGYWDVGRINYPYLTIKIGKYPYEAGDAYVKVKFKLWACDADKKFVELKKYTPLEMVDEVYGIIDDFANAPIIPDSALKITGTCSYRFANSGWNWFINKYGDKITTSGITGANNMFESCRNLTEIPFEINIGNKVTASNMFNYCNRLTKAPKINGTLGDMDNMFENCNVITEIPDLTCDNSTYRNVGYVFRFCDKLKQVPYLYNLYPSNTSGMFGGCYRLREIPEDYCDTWNWSRMQSYNYASSSGLFSNCYSLRKISTGLLNNMWNVYTSSYSNAYNSAFNGCSSLDEINGLGISTASLTSNVFTTTFTSCSRLKNFTFQTNEDGTPKTAKWKSQTIDLSATVGYATSNSNIVKYNSGITADKEVKDDATYQALKNDADWFTLDINYSRYNHTSAVNTINSLPDCSATGTNTIKFQGAAGALTDGGAINTLTEEEIAVAVAKGWTVSLV